MMSEQTEGKKVPLRDNGFVLRIMDNLQELEEQTRPGEGDEAPGKDIAAFKALQAAATLVSRVAGWALAHQRGLAEEGLRFVPRVPRQTKNSIAYLESKAAVDTHEHERIGSLGNELSALQARRFVANVLHPMDFGLSLPKEMVEALDALDYGETLPIVDAPMTARNIFNRVEKLEARRRPDELLLIWRLPGAPVSEAVADARFATGDRVICAEWFGDGSPPAPRWFRKRLSSEMARPEYEYITRSLNRLVEAKPAHQQGFVPVSAPLGHYLTALSDNDLLHLALGVET
jgi:hypothetical protein